MTEVLVSILSFFVAVGFGLAFGAALIAVLIGTPDE